jgi:peroxiredoxin-like protein
MKPFPHHYDAHLVGGATGYAELSSEGLPDLAVASPVDFDGPGDAWSPEHLLLGAVEACFLLTFRAVARYSKFNFVSMEVDAEGILDRIDGVTRFTEITLRPKLIIAEGEDRERALRLLEKAEKQCLITASLSTPVRLQPEVVDLIAA